MKLFISAPVKDTGDHSLDKLSKAIHDANLSDFCLVRDFQSDEKALDDPKGLWAVVRDEIGACDGLIIDVTHAPNDARMVEVGIAYAQRLPIIVVKKRGTEHKQLMGSVSEHVIEYDDYKDLSGQLKRFDRDRSFNITDKSAMLVMFLLVGGLIAWQSWLFFAPLAIIAPVIYWLVVRQFFASMRVFDRVVILIPLALLWLSGLWWLKGISIPLAVGWTLIYWVVAIIVLRRMRLSL